MQKGLLVHRKIIKEKINIGLAVGMIIYSNRYEAGWRVGVGSNAMEIGAGFCVRPAP
jgi:hypothetical protein